MAAGAVGAGAVVAAGGGTAGDGVTGGAACPQALTIRASAAIKLAKNKTRLDILFYPFLSNN